MDSGFGAFADLHGRLNSEFPPSPGAARRAGGRESRRPAGDASWVFDATTPARRKVLDLARRAAPASCPVLVLGPTGVGKEVLATDIHRHSPRADGPFIPVNCATASSSLFESEFFGHVRGAFTGATTDKPGLVELANGGTLFLDEVGELPLDTQAKLLRFLAQGTYWPLGATRERRSDVRIVAATHRRLDEMAGGAFREDLFYRLSVVVARIPPLEPRDVVAIARSLAASAVDRHGGSLSPQELEGLAEQCALRAWPGGARELRNAIERFIVLRDPALSLEDHCSEILRPNAAGARGGAPAARPPDASLAKHLDNLVFLGMAHACHDVRELAQRTDRTVQSVYGRLKKLGLGPQDVGATPGLLEAMGRLQQRLEPELPWLHALFTR